MDLLDVVRHSWPRQLQVSAVPTLFQSKVPSYWLCGSVRAKQTLEMCLIKPELPLLVSYSLISWTPSQSQEAQARVMLEVLETESSTSCWQRWTALEPRRTSSLWEQPTDLKLWTKPYWDQYLLYYSGTSWPTHLHSLTRPSFSPQHPQGQPSKNPHLQGRRSWICRQHYWRFFWSRFNWNLPKGCQICSQRCNYSLIKAIEAEARMKALIEKGGKAQNFDPVPEITRKHFE